MPGQPKPKAITLRTLLAALLSRRPVAIPALRQSPGTKGREGSTRDQSVENRDTQHASPRIEIAGTQPGWLRVLNADALLQVVQAHKAISEIWRVSRLSRAVFERDCLCAIRRYAEFVQLLPASEAHHHAHAGGLLSHTIEVLLAALTWRNGHLLPEGAPIEVIDAQRDEWTLVVFYAALLHDVAKALTDLRVTWRARDMDAVRWTPLAGSLIEIAQGRAQAQYLVEFTAKVERDYSAHSRMAILLLQHIASPAALAALARQPMAFEALNRYLSGQDRQSLLAQIVRNADKASVQRALANGSRARFATARAEPLVDLMMDALKTMLRRGTFPLNRNGAAGWVYDGSLWLVSKSVADKTREWLAKHDSDKDVPGPAKNDRLFDTWQEYGCVMPNPYTGGAIWYVTVHGHGGADTKNATDATDQASDSGEGSASSDPSAQSAYSNTLTMLRFPLEKIYGDPSSYPPPMLGTIEVHEKRKGKTEDAATGPNAQDAEPEGDEQQAQQAHQADVSTKTAPEHGSAKPQPQRIKAPTFNKPGKDKQDKPAAASAGSPSPQTTGAAGLSCPSPSGRPADDDEAAYLLDPKDAANPQAMRREREEREQRMLAKAARQAQNNAGQAKTASPAQSPDAKLSQPVGGQNNRLLLHSIPSQAARSIAGDRAQSEPPEPSGKTSRTSESRSLLKPVRLEPQLPKLPVKHRNNKSKRQEMMSPIAEDFLRWVQSGLEEHRLTYNQSGAVVHFIEQGMALVSPLIFKMYAATQVAEAEIAEHAMSVQREVVKARMHVMGANDVNILRFKVMGRAGSVAGHLAAVVLAEPQRYVHPVPPVNPVLKLESVLSDGDDP
jgi:integrating conjugative element relaxase (TIGR03760 family)